MKAITADRGGTIRERGFVRDLAGAVARAHKEGGFLGVGGKDVSPEEQTALDEIEGTLG